jgi:hypothetical protein
MSIVRRLWQRILKPVCDEPGQNAIYLTVPYRHISLEKTWKVRSGRDIIPCPVSLDPMI